MAQTETYKNVKKIENKRPSSMAGGRDMNDSESRTDARGTIAGMNLGIASSLGPFGPQIEEFILQQAQGFADRFTGNFDEIRTSAVRYARQYPTLTIVGTALLGAAAGLLLVNAQTLMSSTSINSGSSTGTGSGSASRR